MIKLKQVSLLDILPLNLKNDKDIIAAAKAIDNECINILNTISEKLDMSNIDKINNEHILDALALEAHVDFYDLTLNIDVKRNLVKNSLYLHRKKGTKSAVESLVKTVFGDGEVLEWYEYGGKPYYFKVVTENSALVTNEIEYFMNVINTVKNERSKLEKIEIHYKLENNMKYGCAITEAEKVRMETEVW